MSQHSILFVHAHPDDECLSTGATIAKHAQEGANVSLVCMTDGCEGEIAEHLDVENMRPNLAEVRATELESAAAILGVASLRMFGYRDSGMDGTDTTTHPEAFCNLETSVAVERLVEVIELEKPQVVVTYNERGGYGHPDHIKTHEVTRLACEVTADVVQRIYWTAFPRSLILAYRESQIAAQVEQHLRLSDEMVETIGIPDELIDTVIHSPDNLDRVIEAMKCHETQLGTIREFLSMPREVLDQVVSRNHFQCFKPTPGPTANQAQTANPVRATSLFPETS